MNKKLNIVFNVLIIMLIIALVAVMMNYYYTDTVSNIPTDLEIMQNDIIPNNSDANIISNNTASGNNEKDTIISIKDKVVDIEQNSVEVNQEEKSGENGKVSTEQNSGEKNPDEQVIEQKTDESSSPVIMTSENDISSKEKGEILSELDKTLMELLEVVDKVQTVDETRLIIDDGEVQQ